MKIYISVPSHWQDFNKQKEKADCVAAMLSRQGHIPINPLVLLGGIKDLYGEYLGNRISTLIDKCDAVYLGNGWDTCPTCRVEHYVAREVGKKVLFENEPEPIQFWQ